MCIFALAIMLGGWLSDRYGRKVTLKYPCIGFIVLSYPLFQLLQLGDYQTLLIVQGIFAFMMGIFFGTIPTALVEIMPTTVRFSGLSIAHNVSMAIFGGGTPLLAAHLIQYTGNLASPAYLLIGAGILSLSSLWFMKDRYRSELD
jgi:MHS family proline/betaine transporter-like MFS transporter